MKPLTFLIIILLSFQRCKPSEEKKLDYHNLKESLSPFLSNEDTLFKTFYNKEFLQALDTMRFEGSDLPIKLSLMEYYGGSFYSVTHLKFLFSSYPSFGRVYFFKYENNKWDLKWLKETSPKSIDSIRLVVKTSIDEDKSQLARDSSNYRAGDLVRYTIIDELIDSPSIGSIIINKPGDILLNTLMDLKRE